MKRLLVGIALALTIVAGVRAYYANRQSDQLAISVGRATQGSVIKAVRASGTLQAVTTVQVGTQVSGTVSWLGADFNSLVRKGQVIARLDPSLVDAQILQAEAGLARAEADVEQARVQVADAAQKHARAQSLASGQLISRSELEAATVAVDVAQAQLKGAQAQVVQAQAALNQSQVNRQHAVVTAPIDGIVIERSVDVGQTVAASLSSPTLFSIAADLTRMQVQVNIDESDIGAIRTGQHVTFSVEAYPGEAFSGTTTQVRLQPIVVENVTTYIVIVDVPNQELKLKPGMTATVTVETARRDDVVRIPNAALRFAPTDAVLAALGFERSALPESGRALGSQAGLVWIKEGDGVRPIAVRLGVSDGQMTELVSGDLGPGAEVVTSVRLGATSAGSTVSRLSNPFSPPAGAPSAPRSR